MFNWLRNLFKKKVEAEPVELKEVIITAPEKCVVCNIDRDTNTATEFILNQPKKRGRPKGSKNKPKTINEEHIYKLLEEKQ